MVLNLNPLLRALRRWDPGDRQQEKQVLIQGLAEEIAPLPVRRRRLPCFFALGTRTGNNTSKDVIYYKVS